jgi:hypothetical protein
MSEATSQLVAHLRSEVAHVRSITSQEYLDSLTDEDDDPREFFQVVEIKDPAPAKVAFRTTSTPATDHEADTVQERIEVVTEKSIVEEWYVDVRLMAPQDTPYHRTTPYRVRFSFTPQYIPGDAEDASSTTFKSPCVNFLCVMLHESVNQDTGELRTLRDGVDLVEGLAIVTQVFRGATHPCKTCDANYAHLSGEHVKRAEAIHKFREKLRHEASNVDREYNDLFLGQPSGNGVSVLWQAGYFHADIRAAVEEQRWGSHGGSSTDTFQDGDHITRIDDDVFSFPLLNDETCDALMRNINQFSAWGFEAERPNSMNRYGVVVNNIGMEESISELLERVLEPIGARLYGQKHGFVSLERNHSFVVKYELGQDTGLDMHIDDSDITFNIALTDTFQGGDLAFCGRFGEADHRQYKGRYAHRKGHCVVHLGVRRHGAMSVESGKRCNLIVWGRCLPARRAGVHRVAREAFEKESGPPSVQCVSRVHDRDYHSVMSSTSDDQSSQAPQPSDDTNTDTSPESTAWCPPPAAEYDDYPSSSGSS